MIKGRTNSVISAKCRSVGEIKSHCDVDLISKEIKGVFSECYGVLALTCVFMCRMEEQVHL